MTVSVPGCAELFHRIIARLSDALLAEVWAGVMDLDCPMPYGIVLPCLVDDRPDVNAFACHTPEVLSVRLDRVVGVGAGEDQAPSSLWLLLA